VPVEGELVGPCDGSVVSFSWLEHLQVTEEIDGFPHPDLQVSILVEGKKRRSGRKWESRSKRNFPSTIKTPRK
jgi:hypothetical protein